MGSPSATIDSATMKYRRLVCWIAVGLLLPLCAVSCNREKVPRLGSVTGTVTMDGQPVANATVIFDGANAGEPAAFGRTDSSGKYELYYSRGHKGTTIGEHVVHISTYDETGDDDKRQVQKETIPTQYNMKSE